MFYSSNQQKQRQYLKLRRAEEENADIQQDALDQQLAAERGFETRASNLTRLARRVASNIGEESNPLEKPKAGLKAINFSDMIQKIIGLDPLTLSKKARIVWKDLNSADFRNNFNEFMLEEADKIKNKGVSQTDMMSELLNIARNALYGGDERIERELEEKASTYAGSEGGYSAAGTEGGSDDETWAQTIAEIEKDIPAELSYNKAYLANTLAKFNGVDPYVIKLRSDELDTKKNPKLLGTRNKTLSIAINKGSIELYTNPTNGMPKKIEFSDPYVKESFKHLNKGLLNDDLEKLNNKITNKTAASKATAET